MKYNRRSIKPSIGFNYKKLPYLLKLYLKFQFCNMMVRFTNFFNFNNNIEILNIIIWYYLVYYTWVIISHKFLLLFLLNYNIFLINWYDMSCRHYQN